MLKLFEKRSIIYLWIVTYAIMLITPIIANIYVFNNVHQQLKNELYTTNQYFLNNISKTFDSVFSDVNTINIDIQRNKNISDILKSDIMSSETRYLAAAVVDDLYYERLNSQYISDVFVYCPKLDLIITSDAFYESETYFRYRVGESEGKYQEWMDNLLSSTNKTILGGNINNNGEAKKVIRFIEPMNVNTGDNRYIINVYIESNAMFKDIEDADKSDKKSMLILNSRNEILFKYGEFKENDILKNLNFKKEYEMSNFYVKNIEFSVAHVKSKVYRYKYVYVTPNNVFRQKINQALLISIFVNALCLVLMSIIIAYFTKWNYGKISSILGSLMNEESDNILKNKNEYQLIKETIDSAVDERQKLESKLELQNDVLKNGFLSDYLKGFSKQMKNLDDRLNNYGIKFQFESFVVVTVYISDFGVMTGNAEKNAVYIIKNIMNDLPSENDILWVEMDGMLFGIININSICNENYKSTLKTLFENACDLAYQALEINFNVAVSSKKNDFESIPDLYREAVSTLEYSSFYEVYETTFYDDIKELNSVSLYNYSHAKENALIVNIKTGNKEESKQVLHELFNESIKAGYVDKLAVKGLTYNIVNTMVTIVDEIDDVNVDNIFKDMKYFEDLEKCRSVWEFESFLFGLLEKIFEGYKNTNDKSTTIYDKVKDYVDKYYAESDLYVSSIGEHFNMSSLYLSRIFKAQSGIKLSYYINNLRINKAKIILKSSENQKIDDIAKIVGYENTRTFINTFKEREGITPTQFRNN